MADPKLDAFKTDINLVEYAASCGYELLRHESSRNSAAMKSAAGDKIIVSRNGRGYWVYFSVHDDGDNGTIVDFVLHRVARGNLGKVKQELGPWLSGSIDHPSRRNLPRLELEPSSKDRQRVLASLAKMHAATDHAYLAARGLDRTILSDPRFRGQVFVDDRRNAVFPNIGERMGIGSKLKNPPRTVYLEDVVAFCNFLRDQPEGGSVHHLEVGAALQGLAGLQLQEALRLKWTNVDLERGLIEVTGEVKNDYRNRVIPVTGRVLEALRRADDRRRRRQDRLRSVVEHVIVGVRGESFVEFQSYSRQLRGALRRWNPTIDWAPKDLRNCLPTFAKLEGIHSTIWEQYIGHSPGTITERHYVPRLTARTSGELNALSRAMELFRKFVVGPLEAHELAPKTCNFLQLSVSEVPEEGEKRVVTVG